LKQALISDRRESIIKGSVIPSFHKCILIAVGLAGLAWFNAPLAVIAAVGGFAASKNLTKKERALMMDDIEIELELVEKEIQMADSRNQVKKMRQLMKMKKTLQREYQRIKYNIRIGKDIIPSTSYLPDNVSGGGR
jgi:ribonuclease HII